MTQSTDKRKVKQRTASRPVPRDPARDKAIEKIADIFVELYGPALEELEKH